LDAAPAALTRASLRAQIKQHRARPRAGPLYPLRAAEAVQEMHMSNSPQSQPADERRAKVTLEVAMDRLDAFNAMLDEFWTGESKWDVLQLTQKKKREESVQALGRLFKFATHNSTGGSKVVAEVLASLYNGTRFKVDLTDLRLLDDGLHADVLAVLYLDKVPKQEVHQYFANGGKRFEAMFRDYGLIDYVRLKNTGDGSLPPPAQRGVLQHDVEVSATLVTYGDAPGYRDASLVLDCEAMGDDREVVGKVRLRVQLNHPDTTTLLHHLQRVIAFSWKPGRRPLDAEPNEQRPAWLDRPTSASA
jgi:hypothetical protein